MSIAAKSSAGKFSAADAQYNTCLAVFWNFLGTMREELEFPLPCTSEITKEHMLELGRLVSHEVTKLGLAMLNSPSIDTVQPIAENCIAHLSALCAYLRALLPLAGPTMRQQVVAAGQGMIGNLRALIGDLMNKGVVAALSADQQRALAKRAGLIWDACDALKSLPLQNRHAIGTRMMGYMMLLKDAAGELKDLGEQAEMAEEEAADLEGEDGNPDEDLDDATRAELEAAGLSFVRAPKPHERALFAPCLAVYRAAAAPLRSIYAHVLKSERACDRPAPDTPAPASTQESSSATAAAVAATTSAASAAGAVSAEVDASAPELAEWRAYTRWLERVCDSFDGVSAAVDQVGASMYPPHDHTEQMRAITSLQRASARVLALAVAHPEAPSSQPSSSASSSSSTGSTPASAPLGTLPWIGEQLNELESAARQLAIAVRAAATASSAASASAAESATEGASLPTEAELEAVAAECREAIRCAKADAGY